MALCKQCGKEMLESAVFCTNCGAPAVQETTTEAAGAPAQYAPMPEPAPFTAAPPVYGAQPVYGAPPAYAPASYGMQPLYRPHNAGPRRFTFINSFLGITLLGALFIAALITGAVTSRMFFSSENINHLFIQLCALSSVAFAAAVSARAKGPDLSIGGIMGFTTVFMAMNITMFDSPELVALVTVAICAAIGLINGVLITLLRIPAIIVTLLTGIIAQFVAAQMSNGRPITGEKIDIMRGPIGAIALFLITLAIAFLIIFFTKLGKPIYNRDKKRALSYVFSYAASAAIASLVGVFLLSQWGFASPSISSGNELFILLTYACLIGSRVLDNRIAPAFYAIAPALLYAVMNNALTINGVIPYLQEIVRAGIVLIFIIIAYALRLKPESVGTDQSVNMPV